MKIIRSLLVLAVLSVALLAPGCAKPPVEEVNNAEEAVAVAAGDNDAVKYAGNILSRANAAIENMHRELASKNYEAAKSFAAEAVSLAEMAIKEGKATAAKIQKDAEVAVSGLKPQINETQKLIDAAKDSGLSLDFNSIDHELDSTYQAMIQAKEALDEEEYADAIKIANSVRANLGLINRQLSETVTIERRKK